MKDPSLCPEKPLQHVRLLSYPFFFFFFPLSISVSISTFFSNSCHLFLVKILRPTLRLSDLHLERGSGGKSLVNGWRG